MNENLRGITRADQIETRMIRDVFVYWQSKRVGEALPRRADIDPAEIRHLIPNLLIADIEYDPFRVRYRLVGTKIVEMTGEEFTGRYLDEIVLPNDEGPFQECYQAACEWKIPVTTRIKWHLAPDTIKEYDICILPLSDTGDLVNMALAIEDYENVEQTYTFPAGRPTVSPAKLPKA